MLGRCKLCGLDKKLIKAHIIPESFYKELYDEKHGFTEVRIDNEKQRTTRRQKGAYDKTILCLDCDKDFLGRFYDDYAAKTFWGYKNLDLKPKSYHKHDDKRLRWSIFENVDSSRMKLFFLSVLWRAHVSNHLMFEDVDLGEKHGERIRQMILNKDCGKKTEYPILLLHYSVNNVNSRKFLSKIIRYRKNSKHYYAFLMAGIFVIWYISENMVSKNLINYVVAAENKFCVIESLTQGGEFIAHVTGDKAFKNLG